MLNGRQTMAGTKLEPISSHPGRKHPVIESTSFTTPHRLCRGDGIFIFHVHPLNLSPEGGSLAMRDTQDAAKRAEIVGAGVPKRRKCVLIARA
jgi:hypothetical protein